MKKYSGHVASAGKVAECTGQDTPNAIDDAARVLTAAQRVALESIADGEPLLSFDYPPGELDVMWAGLERAGLVEFLPPNPFARRPPTRHHVRITAAGRMAIGLP